MVCVKYLSKINKAVVGVRPLGTCPILIGHDLAEVTYGYEHPFFIVLHCTHEDVSQILHQLNLRWNWDYFPLRTDKTEHSSSSVSVQHLYLIIKALGGLTAAEVWGDLVDVTRRQRSFHSRERFLHGSQTLEERKIPLNAAVTRLDFVSIPLLSLRLPH